MKECAVEERDGKEPNEAEVFKCRTDAVEEWGSIEKEDATVVLERQNAIAEY